MKNYLSLFLMMTVLFVTSCSKEEISTPANTEQQEEVTIVYKGISYVTQRNDNEGLDNTRLPEDIQMAMQTAHVFDFSEESKIYLFDTNEELEDFFDTLNPQGIQNRIPVGTTRTSFFADAYFRSNARLNFDNNFSVSELRHRQPATNNNHWHDVISSLHITNSLNTTFYVRLYEHRYFGGRTLTFSVPRHTIKFVRNLRDYNFNDITSGLRGWH